MVRIVSHGGASSARFVFSAHHRQGQDLLVVDAQHLQLFALLLCGVLDAPVGKFKQTCFHAKLLNHLQYNQDVFHSLLAQSVVQLLQRKGLNIGGQPEPLFVVAIDVKKNQVILGPRSALNCTEVSGVDLNLMVSENSPLLQGELTAHIRLGHKGAPAHIESLDTQKGLIRVRFDESQFASAPGQVLVLYADAGVVASAIITAG